MKSNGAKCVYFPRAGRGKEFYDLSQKEWVSASKQRRYPHSYYAIPSIELVSISKRFKTRQSDILGKIVAEEVKNYPFAIDAGPGKVYASKETGYDTNSTSIHIVVVPGDFGDLTANEARDFRGYFPTIAFIQPPEYPIALWREGSNWVAGFTKNGQWVHVAALGSLRSSISGKLTRIAAELSLHDSIGSSSAICIWDDDASELEESLKSVADAVIVKKMPDLIFPDSYEIIPNRIAREGLAKRKKFRSMLSALFAGLVIVTLGILGGCDLKSRRTRNMYTELQLGNLQPDAAKVSEYRLKWNSLGSSVEPAKSPIEVLYLLSKLAGERGLRFADFEAIEGVTITFSVQANTMREATRFETVLENSKELESYQWNTSEPRIVNKLITFKCSGSWKKQ